jgi:hypothetical protein
MSKRDMTKPNWKRTLTRLRRNMAELRALDVQCIEPPNFDKPPAERYAQGGIITGVAVVFGDHENGPELLVRRSGDHGLS